MDVSRRRHLNGGASRPGAVPARPGCARACFVEALMAYGDCLKACPTGLLARARVVCRWPTSAAACTFCGDCAGPACATGAIGRDTAATAWSFSIAIADSCLAVRKVECRVCGEARRPRRSVSVPVSAACRCPVDAAACNGCGACIARPAW